MEQALIERYRWSLYDLDRTDIDSLIPYVLYIADRAQRRAQLPRITAEML